MSSGQIPSKWHIGSATDAGIKRRGRPNEDAVGAFQPTFASRPPLVIVADGMGGYRGGALASKTVVETFMREYRKMPGGLAIADILERLVKAAHVELNKHARRDARVADMGSTVVAAVLGPDRVGLVNVGDSRAYLLRDRVLRQISADQSKTAEMVKSGRISEAEARVHPERSMLTMSLSPKRSEVRGVIGEVNVVEGNALLLCSDGLWITLSADEIATVIRDLEPQPAADKLVELANMSQAADNVSVIVARLGRRSEVADLDDDTGNLRTHPQDFDATG